VDIYDTDPITGNKKRNRLLSYVLKKVPERIGCKINTKSQYYDNLAILFYERNKKVLLNELMKKNILL